MQRQFTTTVYVIEDSRVLLIHHLKFNKWHPPGGHLHSDETPCEAALREVREETGLEVELHQGDGLTFDFPNGRTLTQPLCVALYNVPAGHGQEAHQHIDLSYLARPIGGTTQVAVGEASAIRWFTRAEVQALKAPTEIFHDARAVILNLLP